MTPVPYLPRPWQLPHMLATPIGGKVLIVERCKPQPEFKIEDGLRYWIWKPWESGIATGTPGAWWLEECNVADTAAREILKHSPLGPVGTVLACKERRLINRGEGKVSVRATFYHYLRTTAIDLRRVDTMTAREANLWGVAAILDRDGTDADRLIAVVTEQEAAKERYLSDNPGAAWGDWAWFITAERTERCD